MKYWLFVVFILLAFAAGSWGTEFKAGNEVSIPSGTTVPDDLFAFSGNVNVAGAIQGDLVASGGNVIVSGSTTDDLMVAGGQLSISGKVGDDLLAAGGDLQISGPITDNAVVTGGTVTIADASTIGRDLTVAGGQVTINGKVGRNVMANGGEVTIGPNAVIHGNLVYGSGKQATISPGAKIMGRTIYNAPAPKRHHPFLKALLWVYGFICLFIVGMILIALAPATAAGSADRMLAVPWISLLTGLIIMVLAPIVLVIVFATVIGIPLALILLAVYLIALYLSLAYAGIGIGRLIFRALGNPNMSLHLDLLVGLLILGLLTAIPFVGWLFKLLATLFGLGALAIQRRSMMSNLRAEGKL